MSQCSFCGAKEIQTTPICQSCGALRYPVANKKPSVTLNRQKTLKASAALAAAIITPGSLIVIAIVGVSRLNTKK